MKYLVNFELSQPTIRSDYRSTFISFFKKSSSSYMDGHFYVQLYDNGTNKKSLVWSVNFQKPVFNGNMMTLAGNVVKMTLKIEDTQTALIFFQVFC